MQPAELFFELRRVVDQTIAPQILLAIRQDELIWNSLHQSEFLRIVVAQQAHGEFSWTPAEIAMLSLNGQLDIRALSAPQLPALDGNLRRKALTMFEETLRSGMTPGSIQEAGLLALALRERRRKTQTWKGLFDELLSIPGVTRKSVENIWKTPLAILFGIVADPMDFLTALLPAKDLQPSLNWISHVLLCNPASIDEQVRRFAGLMAIVDITTKVEWLRLIRQAGQVDLVTRLAGYLLASDREAIDLLNEEINPAVEDWLTLARRSLGYHHLGTLYQFAESPTQSYVYLKKSQDVLRHWLSGIGLQATSVVIPGGVWGESSVSSEYLALQLQNSERLQVESVFAQSSDDSGYLLDQIPEGKQSPLVRILMAGRQTQTGSRKQAQEIASLAANQWVAQIKINPDALAGQFVFDWQPMRMITILVELGLYQEAIELGMQFLSVRSTDIDLILTLSQLQHRMANEAQAINLANQAIILEMDQTSHYRWLATLYESQSDWESALIERQNILEMVPPPAIEDHIALAKCAFGGKKFEEVVHVCQIILAIDPDHGLANTYQGMAYAALGKVEDAIQSLSKATLLIPENALPWIQLAEAHKLGGDTQRALETLRAATLTAPDSAEVYFALGKACIDNGLISDALPFLRQSARLAPEAIEVALALANTLRKLGYSQEARSVVENARFNWPAHAGLAYLNAELVLDQGDRLGAIPLMETALKAEVENIDWYLGYAQAIANLPDALFNNQKVEPLELVKAQKALQKALALKPEAFQPRLLMAEVLSLRDEKEAAFAAYHQLIDAAESRGSDAHWRVQAGMGRVALGLNQTETALVSLQEAAQANPHHLGILRLLTEVYLAAHLNEEAYQAAQNVLALESDEINNLIWFAEVAAKLGRLPRAIEVLRTAVELNSNRVDVRIRLAGLLVRNDQLEAAKIELQKALENNQIDAQTLFQAADQFLTLGENQLALNCYLKIQNQTPELDDRILFEMACLFRALDQDEEALAAIQDAIRANPNTATYYVLQSSIYSKAGKSQAAIASLEHALRLRESQNLDGDDIQAYEGDPRHNSPIFKVPSGLIDIHLRFAKLLRKMENYASAHYHAEKAVALCPDNLEIRYLAADLAAGNMQFSRVEELINLQPIKDHTGCFTSYSSTDDAVWWAGLIAMQVEYALEQADYHLAACRIEEGLAHDPNHNRLLANKVRLLAYEGNHKQAKDLFEELWKKKTAELSSPAESDQASHKNIWWLAEAALAVQDWDRGLGTLEAYAMHRASEPKAQFYYARGLVRAAFWQRICERIQCDRHSPGASWMSAEAYAEFKEAIDAAQKLCRSDLVDHWKMIGEVVFYPSLQNIKKLDFSSDHVYEKAAAVLGAGIIGEELLASQITDHQNQEPLVNAVYALYLLDQISEKGLLAANKAVRFEPNNPIFFAILAKNAAVNNDFDLALESIEKALNIWPDEPAWQIWAVQYAEAIGERSNALEHLEKAVSYLPENFDLLCRLSKYYLQYQEYSKAIGILLRANQLKSDQPQLWLDLAEAYLQTGENDKALKSAERAGELEPSSGNALVMCGEIALKMGDEEKALNLSRMAISRDPGNEKAILLTVHVLEKKGRNKEALEQITFALRQTPDSQMLQLEQARLVYQIQGAQTALPLLMDLSRKSEDEEVMRLLAHACADTGDLQRAEKFALQSIKVYPGQPDLHLLLGQIYEKLGQLDKSIYHLSEAIKYDPEEMESYIVLGRVYQTRREISLALKVFQSAIQASPEDYRPYYYSGLALRDGKDYQGSETMLRRAAQLAPTDVNIRRQLGAVVALNLVHNCQEANSCQ